MKLHHPSGLLANIGNASIFRTEKKKTGYWKGVKGYHRVSRAQGQKNLNNAFNNVSPILPFFKPSLEFSRFPTRSNKK
jgi:hypothetical protein